MVLYDMVFRATPFGVI